MGAASRRLLAAFCVLLALGLGLLLGWRRAGPPDLSRWEAAVGRAARAAGLEPSLLLSMVAVESGGRPEARSPRGARGLLQLMPATAEEQARRLDLPWEGPDSLDDPATNLRLGAGYLARLLERFGGDLVFALAAYNAGPTAVGRWRRRAPDASPWEVLRREGYAETRAYVRRVLSWRGAYSAVDASRAP